MSASASNLSSGHYGYDLVCATTQASINATLMELLTALPAEEISGCYTIDESGNYNVTPLATIEAQIGGDPFSIPNGADQTNPMVQALDANGFAYAFKATMGLPAGIQPQNMPDIVVLNKGNAQVTYNLYCATFTFIRLQELPREKLKFLNCSQPDTAPWTFSFAININLQSADFTQLPASVQAKIENLNPDSIFSVQQLYLDLNSKALESLPVLSGISKDDPVYNLLTTAFVNAFWSSLGSSGSIFGGNSILLGYAVTPNSPNTAVPSLKPTSLNFEVSPNLDGNGNPTTLYDLYTLNWLVMSQNSPMPPATPFAWNWVEQSEQADFDGTMAIRRDIFMDYLLTAFAPGAQGLSIDTNVSMDHDGEDFSTSLSAPLSQTPAAWQLIPNGGTPGTGSFTNFLTISYDHPSSDDSEDALHLASIHGTLNYSMNGAVAVDGNVIQMTIHSVVYAHFDAHGAGITVGSFDANVVDISYTLTLTLNVNPATGQLTAQATGNSIADNSQSFDVSTWDEIIGLDDYAGLFGNVAAGIKSALTANVSSYEANITAMMNNSGGWVFPGAKTFAFKDVAFSANNDLVAHVTYVAP